LESDWRFNVAEFGMVASGWELCARVAGSPSVILVVKTTEFPGKAAIYFVPTILSLPVLLSVGDPPPGHPHFPFGAIVLPD